jgi:uncharacterized protein (DUF2141 family)
MNTVLSALFLTAVATSFATQDTVGSATLTVRLIGFEHDRGAAMIALTTERGFLADRGALQAQSVAIRDGWAECVFTKVPYGRYAVQAYHDENNNKKLDTGMFGIPSEPYGFSNNAKGSFGPPKYSEAEFPVTKSTELIEIRVQ